MSTILFFTVSTEFDIIEGAKQKPSFRDQREYKSCIEMNNHRCVKENGEMDLEIFACDNIHKAVNAEQAELVCSMIENCQDSYENWKCFSNGYPIHCWQCISSDFTSKIVRNQQRFKHYNGELDSRGVPTQIHHSLKRMTIVSIGIDLCVGSVLIILARRLSKGRGSPLAQYIVSGIYLTYIRNWSRCS